MKKLSKFLSLLLSISLLFSMVINPIGVMADTGKTYGFDNLNNESGELKIGFIGGSITIGTPGMDRYSNFVTDWFEEEYPNKTVTQINAGIGGTGSTFGMYRVNTDIGEFAPDVVFVEFAVNDTHTCKVDAESVKTSMETIVRNLLALPKEPVIVFLYSAHDGSYGDLATTTIPQHEKIAEYYNISSINFYDYMQKKVADGTYIWEKRTENSLTDDGVHPNNAGHKVYGDFITEKLESEDILHKNNNVYTPLSYNVVNGAYDIAVSDDSVTKSGTWNEISANDGGAYTALKASSAGESLAMEFEGSRIGVSYLGGMGSWVIDEGTETEKSGTFGNSASDSAVNYPNYSIFSTGLSDGTHTIKVTNTGTDENTNLRVARFLICNGTDSVVPSAAANGDYIPGSKPKNLIKVPYSGNLLSTEGHNGEINSPGFPKDEDGNKIETQWSFTAAKAFTSVSWYGVAGMALRESSSAATVGWGIPSSYTFEGGKTYVFRMRAKTASGSPVANILWTKSGVFGWNNEYGKTGTVLDTDWQEYAVTVTVPSDQSGGNIRLGLSGANAAGDAMIIDLSDNLYFAEEVAWDITNSPRNGNKVEKGESAIFDAAVINQVGLEGTLTQSFTWSVVDSEGNPAVGITAVPSSDNTYATITAESEAIEGTYYVKAVSTDYNMQKTAELQVFDELYVSGTKDYVPQELNDNLLTINQYDIFGYNSNSITRHYNNSSSYKYWCLKANTELSETDGGVYGFKVDTVTTLTTFNQGEGFDLGENLVFKFMVQNLNTNLTPKINAYASPGVYSKEYPDGFTVAANDEWQEFSGTLKLPGSEGTKTKASLWLGFMAGTAAESDIAFNAAVSGVEKMYIAKEAAYNITNEMTSEDASLLPGESAEFKAEVINQVGSTGYLNQNFTWKAVNNDRTAEEDGIVIIPSEDTTTAEIRVKPGVAAGEYVIVAISDDYGMARGYKIVVEEPENDVINLELTEDGTLSALSVIAEEKAKVFLVAYRGEDIADAASVSINSEYGVAKLESTLTLTSLQSGDRVCVFVWDAKLKPFTMGNEVITEIVIK